MSARTQILELQNSINQAILGQEAVVRQILLALLADGHVLAAGEPAEIIANDRVRDVYLGKEFRL